MARASSSGGGGGSSSSAPPERAGGSDHLDPWELSLEEVLKSYEQPINEEQAWAVCYQCCRGLLGAEPGGGRIRDTADILLHKDGTVSAQLEPGSADSTMVAPPANTEAQMVQSLGFAIYRALDWGLDDSEERELSPQLEQLIDLMANSDSEDNGCAVADEGYGGQEEEEETTECSNLRAVSTFSQVMKLCASRLTDYREAQSHYQAVCRALFVETVELKAFLTKIREAKEMLLKLREDESQAEKPQADLDNLRHKDWVDGDIPPRVKKDAHELILDFIRSRPPLKQVSERRLRPLPQKQRTLHEKILEEIKQERKLRPVQGPHWNSKGFGSLPCIFNACSSDVKSTSCINLSVSGAGSTSQRPARPRVLLKAPTLAEMEEMNISEEEESPSGEMKRTSSPLLPLKRDRSFSEHDLAQLQSEMAMGLQPDTGHLGGGEELESRPRSGSMHTWRTDSTDRGSFPLNYQSLMESTSPAHSALGSVEERPEGSSALDSHSKHLWLEFSHPVESLALTVEEVINVRRVLVKAEMEKFLQNKELYNSLKKGKVCCCCRTKFPLFSWPATCLFCKRAVCTSCSIKIKMPSKKFAHIPVYTLGFESPQKAVTAKAMLTRRRDVFQSLQGTKWRSVEEEFPHIYAHGCILKDVCSDCTGFVVDVVCSSRKSVDVLNTTPRRGRQTQSLYIPNTRTAWDK
uniref:Spire type actin nucleation factor 2 n=1 Tax=Monodelphis domestica TaxID=13616 RepID=A0A5F8GTW3_MONDO